MAVAAPEHRTRFIGLRLRQSDLAVLQRLADEAGVGISTYARLVLEQYIAEQQAARSKGGR